MLPKPRTTHNTPVTLIDDENSGGLRGVRTFRCHVEVDCARVGKATQECKRRRRRRRKTVGIFFFYVTTHTQKKKRKRDVFSTHNKQENEKL